MQAYLRLAGRISARLNKPAECWEIDHLARQWRLVRAMVNGHISDACAEYLDQWDNTIRNAWKHASVMVLISTN